MEVAVISIVLTVLFGVAAIYVFFFHKEKEFRESIKEQKAILNDMVSLIQKRNGSFNKEMTNYVNWLNTEFSSLSVQIFLSNSAMEQLKDKYNIKDTEFISSFQSIITDIQNLQTKKVNEILETVSETVIEEIKKQLGAI